MVSLAVVTLPLVISLNASVYAQDTDDEPLTEEQQGANSSSTISKKEQAEEAASSVEKSDEVQTEATSDNQKTNESDQEKSDFQTFIGPIQPRTYGELTEAQRTFSGAATIIFQYVDGEKVRGLQLQGVFSKGSTTDENDVNNKQIASWSTTPYATVPFQNENSTDAGKYLVNFPSAVLSRPNVIILANGQTLNPGEISNYGEVAKLSQLEIMNLPNEGYTMALSGLQYQVSARADFRYNPDNNFFQSALTNGNNNELNFSWDSTQNKYISDVNTVGNVSLPWQFHQTDGGTQNAYFPVWTTAIRNLPAKDYPNETAPQASLVAISGIQNGAVTVTLKNGFFIERYVNQNGDQISAPPGKIQGNRVGAADGFKYSNNFPSDYDWKKLTYVYLGWHSTFYKKTSDIPGGLKTGTPNMWSYNQGGKPINGVYKLTARANEQHVDNTGAPLANHTLDKSTDFDNYSENPVFTGNPDRRKTVGQKQYIYKGYFLDNENIDQLKTGNPSVTMNQSHKIYYVYEPFQPELAIKSIPSAISLNGVLKKGKVTIPSSSSTTNQISVTNTLGTTNGWNLYAQLEWQDGELGSTSRIVTTSSGLIEERDLFGATTSIAPEVIATEQKLKIGTSPSLVLLGNSTGYSFEGTYTTDLGTLSLEIDDGSKVAAQSYSGTINWNLASVP